MKCLVYSIIFSAAIACISCSDNSSNDPAPDSTTKKPTDTNTRTAPISLESPTVNPYVNVDVSPMDMTYFPVDYPKLKMAHLTDEPPLARVIYSRPHLQGRHLFSGVLKYGEIWRLGANETTELQLYKTATIEGKKVNPGRYAMYCIPGKENWIIAINTNTDSWGLEQDTTKDVARFNAAVTPSSGRIEYFTMLFEKTATGANLLMAWDDIEARLPITF
jgi:hypothetical protein